MCCILLSPHVDHGPVVSQEAGPLGKVHDSYHITQLPNQMTFAFEVIYFFYDRAFTK